MSRLIQGMYGSEFAPTGGLFGLRCGQMSGRYVAHNAGWYNKVGEKLGWGDLDSEDIQRVAHELKDDELFIILSERDSFWSFVIHPGLIGSMSAVKPDVNATGVSYVAEHAMYVLSAGEIYSVPEEWQQGADGDTIQHWMLGPIKVMSRQRLAELTGAQLTTS